MAHFIIVPIKETQSNFKLQIYYPNLTKIRPTDFEEQIKLAHPKYTRSASDEDQKLVDKRAKKSWRTVCSYPHSDVPKFYWTVPKVWFSGNPDEQHMTYRLSKLFPNEKITFRLLNWW